MFHPKHLCSETPANVILLKKSRFKTTSENNNITPSCLGLAWTILFQAFKQHRY